MRKRLRLSAALHNNDKNILFEKLRQLSKLQAALQSMGSYGAAKLEQRGNEDLTSQERTERVDRLPSRDGPDRNGISSRDRRSDKKVLHAVWRAMVPRITLISLIWTTNHRSDYFTNRSATLMPSCKFCYMMPWCQAISSRTWIFSHYKIR